MLIDYPKDGSAAIESDLKTEAQENRAREVQLGDAITLRNLKRGTAEQVDAGDQRHAGRNEPTRLRTDEESRMAATA